MSVPWWAGLAGSALSLWAGRVERVFLTRGRGLSAAERELARRVGVENPAELRLAVTENIPMPLPVGVMNLLQEAGFPVFQPAGMCLGRVVFLMPGYQGDLMKAHEMRHAAQYEALGGVKPFLCRYVAECLSVGYFDAELEKDARSASVEAVAGRNVPLTFL